MNSNKTTHRYGYTTYLIVSDIDLTYYVVLYIHHLATHHVNTILFRFEQEKSLRKDALAFPARIARSDRTGYLSFSELKRAQRRKERCGKHRRLGWLLPI
jgi:hypothetical protein